MIKLNKKYLFSIIIVFFISIRIVSANFEISEVMYDLDGTDTDREWVEVHNTGNTSLDLSKWYLFSDNSKHTITPQGSSMVPADNYAIIAQDITKFKTDWPNYSGLLFDSSWTGFNNESEAISLKDSELNIVSPLNINSTIGGNGDGNSIQRINGSWIGANPTPGNVNSTSNNINNGSVEEKQITSSNVNSTDKTIIQKEPENRKITTQIISKNIETAGVPFSVDHNTIGLKKEKLILGKFIWNFGDGMRKESDKSEPFEYSYEYPGEYVLTLSYSDSFFDTKPDAVDRLIIKVIPSGITITSVGNYNDPYIEIENNSNYEISLNKWTINGYVHSFLIPEGTVILPNKKLKFSPRITGFDFNDLTSIAIIDIRGQVFTTYPNKKTYFNKNYNNISQENIIKSNISKNNQISNNTNNNQDVIDLNNLEASVGNTSSELNIKSSAYIGLAIIIIIGVTSIFLIRRKNEYPEYIEGEVNANDIKIIE